MPVFLRERTWPVNIFSLGQVRGEHGKERPGPGPSFPRKTEENGVVPKQGLGTDENMKTTRYRRNYTCALVFLWCPGAVDLYK